MTAAPAPRATLLVVPVFSSVANLAFALRREVFVLEQGVPAEIEHDADDMTATHVVALLEGEVAATLRMLTRPEHVKIGRVAVARARRGQGLGAALVAFAVAHAGREGQPRCYLESQLDAIGFYERLGFAAYGETFMDAGIPHRRMRNY